MFGEGGGVGRLNLSGLVLLLGDGLCMTGGNTKQAHDVIYNRGSARFFFILLIQLGHQSDRK